MHKHSKQAQDQWIHDKPQVPTITDKIFMAVGVLILLSFTVLI